MTDLDFDMAIINTDSPVTPETDIKMTNIESNTYNKLVSSEQYEKEKETCFKKFDTWSPEDQIDFIEDLLLRMTHYQHGHINTFLKPMLQRDFISALPGKLWSRIGDPSVHWFNLRPFGSSASNFTPGESKRDELK